MTGGKGTNLERLHTAVADMPYHQSLAVRTYLVGTLAASVDPDVWSEALNDALALANGRTPGTAAT